MPTGAAGDPDTVHPPDLATYSSRYFALNNTRDGVVLTAPIDGVTTQHSHYPRSELREMNGADEAAWCNTSGVHTLTLSEAITQLPDAKPQVVAAQIHDAHDDVLQIRLDGTRLLAQYDDGAKQIELDPHYTLGARYTLTVTATDRRVQVHYNDTQKVDLPLTGTGWYFKAGAYVQSNTHTGDRPPAQAQVVIYALTATHTDHAAPTSGSATPPAPATQPTRAPQTAPTVGNARASEPGVRRVSPRCTVRASGTTVPAAKGGDTVCFTGTLPHRLELDRGGTPDAPIVYSGHNTATVPGITVRADNIIVEGFITAHSDSTGIWASGNNIVLRDNDISAVRRAGDDVDAIRFFGDHITIAHNRAHNVWANPDAGGHPHVDCMQTFAHSDPASSHVLIDANKCEGHDLHQCLMAEGPHDFEDGASGIGRSTDWLVTGNYFDCHAPAQTIQLQDIHNVTFTKNSFAGTGRKAIALGRDATGTTVADDNILGPGYDRLVDFDHDSARTGYTGPEP